jgi:hypothetical protein
MVVIEGRAAIKPGAGPVGQWVTNGRAPDGSDDRTCRLSGL